MTDLSGAEASRPRPHSADQSRLRPQYGEYATPEEQLRRSGRDVPPPVVPVAPALPIDVVAANAPAAGSESAAVPATRSHPADRLAALALLAYGLWNVITSVIAYLNPTMFVETMLKTLGVSGDFSNYAQVKTWGTVAAIVLIAGWIATAALTLRRLRRGKLAWWVPLVGGAVFVTVSSFCLAIPFATDPILVSYFTDLAKK